MLWSVVGLILVCTAVSIRGVSRESFWYDELWSLKYAGAAQYGPISALDTFQRVVDQTRIDERTPPLYYIILNVWIHLTGSSEFSTRILSVFAGLIAVAWIFRAGWDFAGDAEVSVRFAVALGAAVALGTSAYFIQYMQDARAYTLFLLFIGMSVALYRRLVRIPNKPGIALQIGLVLGIGALGWLHFTSIVLFFALGLYHLIYERHSAHFRRVIVLSLLGLIPFLLWTPLLLTALQSTVHVFHLTALPLMAIFHDLLISFSNDSTALFLVLLALALLVRGRDARAIWFIMVVSLIAALILNHFVQFITVVRYIIFLLPLFALLVGLGLSTLARHKVTIIPILAIWMVSGTLISLDFPKTQVPYDTRMSWMDIVDILKTHIQPDDLILFHSPILSWSAGFEIDHYMYPFPNRHTLIESIPGLQANNEYFNNALQYLGSAPRIWLGIDTSTTPNFRLGEMTRALSANYVQCYTALNAELTSLDLYAAKVGTRIAPAARFDNGIDIALDEKLPEFVKGTLPVLLGTHLADTVPRGTYSVGLHIDDANGKFVRNLDFGLPDASDSCKPATVDVSGLPDGRYTLYIVIYDWRTTKRLEGLTTSENASTITTKTDRVKLGTFTIQN
jgi:hypothetical protein